jgi:hypothetical protein
VDSVRDAGKKSINNSFMEEEKYSPQDSLRLIQSMIDKAKNTVADDSFYFLLWGWLVFAASVVQYVMKVIMHSPYHYLAWCLMFVGFVVSTWYGYTQHRQKKVKTYIEDLLDYLWISLLITYVLISFIFARTGWENCSPIYILLYSLGNFVTGRVLKFSPLVWGAVVCWALAVISTFTDFDTKILLGALAVLCSNIIPGFLLKKKYRKMQFDV